MKTKHVTYKLDTFLSTSTGDTSGIITGCADLHPKKKEDVQLPGTKLSEDKTKDSDNDEEIASVNNTDFPKKNNKKNSLPFLSSSYESEEDISENEDKKSTSTENTKPNEPDQKNKFDFFTFDLSQDVEHYMNTNNEILKTLEAVKGREFADEEITKFKIWPQGTILYFIDSVSFDKVLSDKIRDYLDVASGLTGLRFLEMPRAPSDDKTRYAFFLNRLAHTQCIDYSHTDFSNSGIQRVILGYDCLETGREIAKIVMALLGIPYQHNAPDRDTYVEYNANAVLPNKTQLYAKVNDEDWLFKDIDYDFRSVTHLPFYKNSLNGHAVLKPLKPVDNINVGESKGFSYSDLHKIRFMYNSIKNTTDEKIQVSNCKKLFKSNDVLDHLKLEINDRYPQNDANTDNVQPVKRLKAFGIVSVPAKTMAKQGLLKLNRVVKQKRVMKALAMKNDPLKWEDVQSDDK